MGAVKGWASGQKLDRTSQDYNTVTPIRLNQSGQDMVSHNRVVKVDDDIVEANSTVSSIVATAHNALRGDVIKFTSGALLGKEVKVYSTSANAINLVEDLASAPATSVTFEVIRHLYDKKALSKGDQLFKDASSTNITTSAYVQLTAASSRDSEALVISNNTTKTLILAVGAAASEVDQCYIPPSAVGLIIPLRIPLGSRISVKALDASATTGFLAISVLG
jgi:hypothetical protein